MRTQYILSYYCFPGRPRIRVGSGGSLSLPVVRLCARAGFGTPSPGINAAMQRLWGVFLTFHLNHQSISKF